MIKIIACGNLLRRDDGVGAYVLNELQKSSIPDGVELIEAGTGILDILPLVQHADKVIVIDAIVSGNHPGTIYRIPIDQLRGSLTNNLTFHDLDLQDLLRIVHTNLWEALRRKIILFGVEVKSIQLGFGLSVDVEKAIPMLVDLVMKEIGGAQ